MKFGSVSDVTKSSVTVLTYGANFVKLQWSIIITYVVQSKFECHVENKYWFINSQISQTLVLATHQGLIKQMLKGISTRIFLSRSLRDFRFFNSYGLAIRIVQNILHI
ncbi:MAG: hypothetical protein WBZ36_03810 [Candidatus Nitrosopolaris sp.]